MSIHKGLLYVYSRHVYIMSCDKNKESFEIQHALLLASLPMTTLVVIRQPPNSLC